MHGRYVLVLLALAGCHRPPAAPAPARPGDAACDSDSYNQLAPGERRVTSLDPSSTVPLIARSGRTIRMMGFTPSPFQLGTFFVAVLEHAPTIRGLIHVDPPPQKQQWPDRGRAQRVSTKLLQKHPWVAMQMISRQEIEEPGKAPYTKWELPDGYTVVERDFWLYVRGPASRHATQRLVYPNASNVQTCKHQTVSETHFKDGALWFRVKSFAWDRVTRSAWLTLESQGENQPCADPLVMTFTVDDEDFADVLEPSGGWWWDE